VRATPRRDDRERPALVGKFKRAPVIEMYRQAAIRRQKVKEWEAARKWARRGLKVYGLEAAPPDAEPGLLRLTLQPVIESLTERCRGRVFP
jgi:hypothetical protein